MYLGQFFHLKCTYVGYAYTLTVIIFNGSVLHITSNFSYMLECQMVNSSLSIIEIESLKKKISLPWRLHRQQPVVMNDILSPNSRSNIWIGYWHYNWFWRMVYNLLFITRQHWTSFRKFERGGRKKLIFPEYTLSEMCNRIIHKEPISYLRRLHFEE